MLCENLVKCREKTKKYIPDFSKPLRLPRVVQLTMKSDQMQYGCAVCHQTLKTFQRAAHNLKPSTWRILWGKGHICHWIDFFRGFGVDSKLDTRSLTSVQNVQKKKFTIVLHISCCLCCFIIWLLLLICHQQFNTWDKSSIVVTHSYLKTDVLCVRGSRSLFSIIGSWLILCQHPPVRWSMTKNKPLVWARQTFWPAPC